MSRTITTTIVEYLRQGGNRTLDSIANYVFNSFGYGTTPRHSIRARLNELTYQGRVRRVRRGVYALVAAHPTNSQTAPSSW